MDVLRTLGSGLLLMAALVAQDDGGATPTHSHRHPHVHSHALEDHEHAESDLKEWTSSMTGEVVRGTYLASREGWVSIEKADGGVVRMPLAELVEEDRALVRSTIARIRAFNEEMVARASAAQGDKPVQAEIFDKFAPAVKTRWDDRWLYVESDGLPHDPLPHQLMVGIVRWQQQVPLPQPYTGTNAWQIPLKPVMADAPISGKKALLRGAIALAANGVPIFNALTNRGEDALLAGELDEFGGHCGRGDDYHYHIAPLALAKVLGPGKPIAYALDGFPIYGLFDPKASATAADACPLGGKEALDDLNGHYAADKDGTRGLYHYHASKGYPYINGGVRGKVTVVDDQIEPQPKTRSVRPWLTALRGAKITGFKTLGPQAWELEYMIGEAKYYVRFRIEDGNKFIFDFVGADGKVKTETYTPRQGGGGGGGGGNRERGGERGGNGGGPGGGRGGNGGGERPPEEGGARPSGTPSKPWILVHAKEVDKDGDGAVTRAEMTEQARLAFDAYDRNQDGKLIPTEYDRAQGARAPRLPLGGFVQLHMRELDPDGDGDISRDEMMGQVLKIFDKSDRNRDGRIDDAELGTSEPASPPPQDGAESRPRGRRNEGGGNRQGGGRQGGLSAQLAAFKMDVPAHPFDLFLVNPTKDSVGVSVMTASDAEGWIEWGVPGKTPAKTQPVVLKAGEPMLIPLTGLKEAPAWEYRFKYRTLDAEGKPIDKEPVSSDPYTFRTPRTPGDAFAFTIQADSHLDTNVMPEAYVKTLKNASADNPDFHVDLGDTFMTDKRRDYKESFPQYLAQRWYFGHLCGKAPLFMVLGNHDGEYGYNKGTDDIAAWSFGNRTKYFPPPVVERDGGFYTGKTSWKDGEGGNWYAFEWGDALIVTLDPYTPTRQRPRGGGARGGESGEHVLSDANWNLTLGKAQYDWLLKTLSSSKAKYKFVFIHHLVGGLGSATRGGVESAPYFEWGGKNADGSDGFAARRPGWAMPIHAALVKYGVNAVFHGHDHLYVQSQLDGVIYQCVPQPGNPRGGTRSAEEYGYKSGTILGSPGYLRVRVGEQQAKVEFVRTSLASDNRGTRRSGDEANGTVLHTWETPARK